VKNEVKENDRKDNQETNKGPELQEFIGHCEDVGFYSK
jgi:hypothetical protein